MTRVYISIGSNIDREGNIRSAVAELKKRYQALILSSVYQSKAVGFEGDDFYNLVAVIDTDDTVADVISFLHELERSHNRNRRAPRFASRTLDLDLLLYGDAVINDENLTLPRGEITEYAFVLEPLAEIAGDEKHPVTGQCYRDLWRAFETGRQSQKAIEFHW